MNKKNRGIILGLIIVTVGIVIGIKTLTKNTVVEEPATENTTTENETITTAPKLTKSTTHAFFLSTHRPEILFTNDKLYLLVVEPTGIIKHKGYIFDATDPTAINFDTPEKEFTVSTITSEYGEPADHRAAIIGNEIWVVYQTLIVPQERKMIVNGPMESIATSQSLMFARFSLEGEEITRTAIATTTDFTEDNFPDFSILPYKNHLLVSTQGGEFMKIREIDENSTVLNTYQFTKETETQNFSEIGNSMIMTPAEKILFFSSKMSAQATERKLSFGIIDENFTFEKGTTMASESEETFPTGNAFYNGLYFISYIKRAASSDMALETNPYYPALKILTENGDILEELAISDEVGFSHVHPTMVIIEDRLFYAWSKKSAKGSPQVHIEEYTLE